MDTEAESEAFTNPCGRLDNLCLGELDRVEGIRNALGIALYTPTLVGLSRLLIPCAQ